MAAVLFASTVIWEDGSGKTGVGSVRVATDEPSDVMEMVPLPRSSAKIVKVVSVDSGRVYLPLRYAMTSEEYNTHRALLLSLKRTVGTLSVPPGQSYEHCVMTTPRYVRGPVGEVGADATKKYDVALVLIFERVR